MDDVAGVMRNVEHARRFSFDIGSRQFKVVYTSSVPKHPFLVTEAKMSSRLHCCYFDSPDLEKVCNYIAQHVDLSGRTIPFSATHPETEHFEEVIKTILRVNLVKMENIDCLIQGSTFLLRNIIDEIFEYDHHNEKSRYRFRTVLHSPHAILYPYLIVNIGTGMTAFVVHDPDRHEKVGGSHLGAGAFFGLAKLLTGISDVSELLKMAEEGDHRTVDALVGDIYGGDMSSSALHGLPSDIIAGSFGKMSKKELANEVKNNGNYRKAFVRSLLLMLSNEISQVVTNLAIREQTKHVVFTGFLVRNHPIIMRTISYAVKYWSQSNLTAHFLRHELYMTAIGALVRGRELLREPAAAEDVQLWKVSWREHYAGCSDLGRFVPKQHIDDSSLKAEVLELDSADILMKPFPLLAKDHVYEPDTVDLNTDLEAREFWIGIMEEGVHKTVAKAVESHAGDPTAEERGEIVKEKYLKQLKLLREKPFAYGTCNVRNLLDLREQILNEHDFEDPFLKQKSLENEVALREFTNVIGALDAIDDQKARLAEAAKGLLAGNVFDWGAKEVVRLLEGTEEFTFSKAAACIPARPWLIDNLDFFVSNTMEGKHKSIVVFVDNSGPDTILGVLPFAREMLKMGSKVLVVSNLLPALNDMTYCELIHVMLHVTQKCPIMKKHYKEKTLKIWHSGQGSPCLDLRRIDSQLCEMVVNERIDLVVVEGMGRALHTNFNAKFSVCSLKAAVIKTRWLADRMGGDIFSVVFKYEDPDEEADEKSLTGQ